MKYNLLKLNKSQLRTRAGRGIAAGKGKTAGRGTKGQNSRGSGTRPGFEGGQNPLMQRIPKLRGFTSIRPKAETVYTGQLDSIGIKVNNQSLYEKGLLQTPFSKVKLIKKGDVAKQHEVSLQFASKGAIELLQKAGGSYKTIPQVMRQSKEKPVK